MVGKYLPSGVSVLDDIPLPKHIKGSLSLYEKRGLSVVSDGGDFSKDVFFQRMLLSALEQRLNVILIDQENHKKPLDLDMRTDRDNYLYYKSMSMDNFLRVLWNGIEDQDTDLILVRGSHVVDCDPDQESKIWKVAAPALSEKLGKVSVSVVMYHEGLQPDLLSNSRVFSEIEKTSEGFKLKFRGPTKVRNFTYHLNKSLTEIF